MKIPEEVDRVDFVGWSEDGDDDLILSFAVNRPDLNKTISLILLRSPKYEVFLEPEDAGVDISYDGFPEETRDLLQSVCLEGKYLQLESLWCRYTLNIQKLQDSELQRIKKILNKMNFDNRFQMIWN